LGREDLLNLFGMCKPIRNVVRYTGRLHGCNLERGVGIGAMEIGKNLELGRGR
jgi:hypothetical protein